MKAGLCAALALAICAVTAAPAAAHRESTGYLSLTVDGATVTGRLELTAGELARAVVLDDGDGAVRWREVEAAAPALTAYLAPRVVLTVAAGPCPLQFAPEGVVDRDDGPAIAIALVATCPGPAEPLTIDYRALVEVDARHRALIRLTTAGGTTAAIARGAPVTVRGDTAPRVRDFVATGVWHIWIGLDHVLFLLALLLPAVWVRRGRGFVPAATPGAVARDVLAVVTAFTVAHSITLAVATAGWLTVPPRLIEPAIAVSVALAALNNLWPVVDGRWAAAFALGLLHGFGFSGVLAELGLPAAALAPALIGFNLGVELGQLAIVVAVLPLAYLARATRAYRAVVLLGSIAMVAIATLWAITRAL